MINILIVIVTLSSLVKFYNAMVYNKVISIRQFDYYSNLV